METSNTAAPKAIWSAPGLALRSTVLGLMVFMAAGVALVPLGNRKLTNVFWVGAAVNLLLFCGVSLAAPIALILRMKDQVRSRGRQALCILSFDLGWSLLPCAGLFFFAGAESRLVLPRWEVLLLFGMIATFVLMAAAVLLAPRRLG